MAKTPRLVELLTKEETFSPSGFVGTVPPTTLTLNFAKYSRIKDKLAGRIRWSIASTSFNYATYTGALIVSRIIPEGLTLSNTITDYPALRNGFGRFYAYFNNSSATNQNGYCHGTIEYINNPALGFRFLTTQRANATTTYSDETVTWACFGNATGDASQFIQLEFMVPIVEWS